MVSPFGEYYIVPVAMLILTVWLGLMGLGGLCYPRRPRATGVCSIVAGGFLSAVWVFGAIGSAPPIAALTSAAFGFGILWRFRAHAVRAAHVAEWSGKA
jgi:hypothetical protein